MSNTISFSYSQDMASNKQSRPPQPLLCVHPFEVMPLNEKTSLLVSRKTGKSLPVGVHLVSILQGMGSFRAVKAHFDNMPPQLKNQTSLQALEQLAGALVKSGLATSSEEFRQTYSEAARASKTEPGTSRVFLLACDREQELKRLLESIFSNADLSLHEGIYLLDDSRDDLIAHRNRALFDSYQSKSSIPLHYYGKAEKDNFIAQLIEQEPQLEPVVRQLLDRSHWGEHKTYGLSRNWALMLSAGYRCIMLDDDVLCEALFPPYADDQVTFASKNKVQVFATEQEWRNQAVPADFDPLAGHLQLLGHDVQTCLEKRGSGELTDSRIEGMTGNGLESLGPDSPVLISECGTFGDPGFPSHVFLLHGAQRDLEELLAKDPDVSLTFGQRQFQAVQQSVSIYDLAGISQITGLDNTCMLPPYFPAFRAEDGLFGWLVKQMYPRSRTVMYNWGIPHQPMENRASSYLEEAVIPKVSLGVFKGLWDRVSLSGQSTPVGRLMLIAAMIRDLAERPEHELLALANVEFTRRAASVYMSASARLPYFSGMAPAFEAYFKYAIQKASESLQTPPSLASWFDMPEECDDLELVSRTAAEAGNFANALESWPRIWNLARQLN